MKVFWAILLGSFAIASAIVFTSEGEGERSFAQVESPEPSIDAQRRTEPAPAPSEPMPTPSPTTLAPETDIVEVEPERATEKAPGPEEAVSLDLDDLLGIETEPGNITPEAAIADSRDSAQAGRTISQQQMDDFAELAMQASESVEEAGRIAGSIGAGDEVRADEGGLVIGRVTIPGSGTAADPYELPWGVLISAIRTYNPRLELNDLPPWAASLSGKHVRLTGFAFLPVVASDTDEILLMLNPWDGCHMGAPPTPYDSVEVMLDDPVNMGGRNGFVTVSGRFNVDPYLIRGWLVSLYTMDGARLEFSGS